MSWKELYPQEDGKMRFAALAHQFDLSYLQTATNCALQHMGIPGQLACLDVPRPEFQDCVNHLESLGFRGLFVANPLKVDAARIAERFWVSRFSLGVANALMLDKGVFAQNTEVPAITACVRKVEPATALVMGTGHAARSVIAGLLAANFKVRVWNRNANKTKIVQSLLNRYGEIELSPHPDPSGCRLIVNATPLGAKPGEQAPLMWNRVLPKTVCFDLVYRRVPTEFLRSATNRGLKTIDGRELLVEQCALALEWWIGEPAPRQPMMEAVGLKKSAIV